MRRLNLLGVPVDDVVFHDAVTHACALIPAKRPAVIVTPNPEFVVLAQKNAEFRQVLWKSELSIPDGIGLLLAARILGQRIHEQVRGTDLAYELIRQAVREDWRVFLLGAGPGIAPAAAARLRLTYPGVSIVGTFNGNAAPSGDDLTRAAVAAAGRVDLLIVAYGAPRQELWMERNLCHLDVGVAIGVGGVLDYMAGSVQRAPLVLRNAGLEWLFRLIRQPWRWRRQIKLVLYARLVLGTALARKHNHISDHESAEFAIGRKVREPPK